MSAVDLDGTWRAAIADPERRRSFSDPRVDDSGEPWHDIAVPGHWQNAPAFADTDGPVLYRHRFDVDSTGGPGRFDVDSTPSGGRRHWLVLDGLFYLGDVWLDGRYLGDTEGYFFAHQFEVTDSVSSGTEHLLAVEVACPPQNDRTHKRSLTGSFQHAAWLDPDQNPGGIWRPVRIETTGPLRFRHTRVRCLSADERTARLAIRAVVDSPDRTTAVLRTRITPAGQPTAHSATDHELTQVLAAGENRVEWTVTVDRPRLWWPHQLGDQDLCDVTIDVFDQDGGPASDRVVRRTGMRSIRLDHWMLSINGERLHLKGTSLGPTRQLLGDASPDDLRVDVALAKDLGLDLIRVHSHISHPELYAAADEAGMLVWQDLPLQWAYARSIRRQALRQAREAVDLLAHHPSVAVWCAHSEPVAAGRDHVGADPSATRRDRVVRQMGQSLPNWNKSLLDPSLRRTLRAVDGTRPVVASSGALPHLPRLDGSSSHLWFGWEYGTVDDLAHAAARWPRLVRFVSEFGAASVPPSAEFCEPERWPDLDWDRLAHTHGLRRDLLDRIAAPEDYDSFDAWREATQLHQAHLLRRQIETLRLLKYRPSGGFTQFLLADAHPAISHSLYDHRRRPKFAAEAVRAACAPLIVAARPMPGGGSTTALDIHLVSDLRHPLRELEVTARVGPRSTRWIGGVDADSTSFVGTVPVPGEARRTDGPVAVDIEVLGPDGHLLTANRYEVPATDR